MKGRKLPGRYRFCMCKHCLGTGTWRKWIKTEARKLQRIIDKIDLRKRKSEVDE